MQLQSEGELRFPSKQRVQGKTVLGDQDNSVLTSQKAIDWLVIYSFFTSHLVLPEEFFYNFELVKCSRFVIF